MRAGVLAIQGDFAAHAAALERLGVRAALVRTPHELEGLDALVLPGGESGAMLRIARENGLFEAVRRFHERGGALFGTCAGAILLARSVSRPTQDSLRLIDLDVVRNGYGRQTDSFEQDVEALGAKTRLVFIRAPRFSRVGPGVTTLASVNGEPVACREGRVLVTAFHPEMTDDPTFHRYFVEQVCGTTLADSGGTEKRLQSTSPG